MATKAKKKKLTHRDDTDVRIQYAVNLVRSLRSKAVVIGEDARGNKIYDMRMANAVQEAFISYYDKFLIDFSSSNFRANVREDDEYAFLVEIE